MPSHRDRSDSPRRERARDKSARDRHRHRERSPREKHHSRGDREDRDYRTERPQRHVERRRSAHDDGEGRKRRRDEDDSDAELVDLEELGVAEISEDDYFLKSAEFKLWLKVERGRYLDEMSSESAHKYFRKFVRRWNDGALNEVYYRSPPSTSVPSSSNTAYKWSFVSDRQKVDTAALASARADVDRLTHAGPGSFPPPRAFPSTRPQAESDDDQVGPSLPSNTPRLGPALPSAGDRQLAVEEAQEQAKRERKAKLKEGYSRADELAPKGVGKEGKMEEKRATNASNKEFREKEVGGLELDEGTLMGDAGGFAAALRARDAAQGRRAEKRDIEMASRRAADEERLAERKQKESATMEMFKAMARERFG